ncbi:hypothetical protein FKM82_030379 [Ascaphus truei]
MHPPVTSALPCIRYTVWKLKSPIPPPLYRTQMHPWMESHSHCPLPLSITP